MRERDVRHRGFRRAYGRHNTEATKTFGIEIALPDGAPEIFAKVAYSVTPYIPEQGPTYACGGQPAEGGEVEDIRVVRLWSEEIQKVYSTVAGSPPEFKTIITELECPQWLADMIVDGCDVAHLAEHAAMQAVDSAYDYEGED